MPASLPRGRDLAPSPGSTLVALLGPTNTGKTHRAIERMFEHESGMIGLPLRLLAREVYDKITMRAGESLVALVTGEEKRIPARPRYWVCTVEAMPLGNVSERGPLEVDFVAIDEIQLAAHPERGHVFTERLLHARGRLETWFMGAETMTGMVEKLLPTARIMSSPRLSRLISVPSVPLGQLARRSAVVAFGLPRVYELGERIRMRRGGAAIVVGALSPRARNAQVALYQSGEVDYMVATDAIGMGLNLDIDHVAFADLRKFDGREARDLEPAEIAQIAGRAGRYTKDGTFGTLAPLRSFSPNLAHDIEEHRFSRVRSLVWRNADLDFGSMESLVGSLDASPPSRLLRRIDRAEDRAALEAFRNDPEWRPRLVGSEALEVVWEVCRIPDYRKLLFEDHVATLKTVAAQLLGPSGVVSADFLSKELDRLSKKGVDIETLMAQVAAVRTWSYVAHQSGWVKDAGAFQARALEIENALADALHEALVARFVDRAQKGHAPQARGSQRGTGSRAPVDEAIPAGPFAALAKLRAQAPEAPTPTSMVEDLVSARHDEIELEPTGVIRFRGDALARLLPGRDLLTPEVRVTADLTPGERLQAHRRLVAFSRDVVGGLFTELELARTSLSPAGRGVVHLIEQGLGGVLAADIRGELGALAPPDLDVLRRASVVVGRWAVYVPRLLKQPAMNARRALASARLDQGSRVRWPEVSTVSTWVARGIDRSLYGAVGYLVVGPRAVRADVLERVAMRLAAAPEGESSKLPLAQWLGCKPHEVDAIITAASKGDASPMTVSSESSSP